MAELKPCPFCGGEAYLERSHRAFIGAKSTKVSFVRCKECNARSGRFKINDYGHTSHSVEAEASAIEAWNRRTENDNDTMHDNSPCLRCRHLIEEDYEGAYSEQWCEEDMDSLGSVEGCYEFTEREDREWLDI